MHCNYSTADLSLPQHRCHSQEATIYRCIVHMILMSLIGVVDKLSMYVVRDLRTIYRLLISRR
jgi:hypothetical protein